METQTMKNITDSCLLIPLDNETHTRLAKCWDAGTIQQTIFWESKKWLKIPANNRMFDFLMAEWIQQQDCMHAFKLIEFDSELRGKVSQAQNHR